MGKNICENCSAEPIEKLIDETAFRSAQTAFLPVLGMGCPRCTSRVRRGLIALDGVLLADAQLENGIAAADYDPQQVTPHKLASALGGAWIEGNHYAIAGILKTMPSSEALGRYFAGDWRVQR